MQTQCPTADKLAALLKDDLSQRERFTIENHLEECIGCREQLNVLAQGDALGVQTAIEPDTPEFRALLERLKPEESGDRIGVYKLLQQVGEGGFGTVWMAEQSEPVKRRVALKIIKLGMNTKEVIARFEQERQALAMMDHPNIAKVFDAGATQWGRPFFAMELVRGMPITGYCDEQELPMRERLTLFVQVCQAVQHAHQKGIIHRDIKPSNILISAGDDHEPVPKIIDFGVAKAMHRTLTDKTLFTQVEQMIGTPAYMSPEQAGVGPMDIDTRSDIYSLGVLLYELLTGKPPFDPNELRNAGYDEVRRVIREEEPPRPSTRLSTLKEVELTVVARHRHVEATKLASTIRGDLDWIVMKALEKNRNRRYETANGLAMDIRRHLAHEPVLARPPSFTYKTGKFVRKHKLPVSASAAVLLALIAGLITAATLYRRETAAWASEAAQRRVAEQAVSRLEIDRIESLFHANDSSKALSFLARLVRQQPTNRVAAERLISALSDRFFCLPIAPLQHGAPLNSLNGAERQKFGTFFPFRYLGSIVCANVSADGKSIITASEDGTARVWDSNTGEPKTKPLSHKAEVMWATFSPDNRKVVTASFDGTARIWDAQSGAPITEPLVHAGPVWHVEFSPDGRQVVTACEDKTARLWDADTGTALGEPMVHENFTYYARFSSDGARILTASRPRSVALWESATGTRIHAQDHFFFRESTAPFPQLNEVSKQALTMRDFSAYLRSADLRLAATHQLKHDGYLLAAAFSPDGTMAATGSMDATARLWLTRSGRPWLPPLRHNGWVFSVAFSSGNFQVTSSGRGEPFVLTGSRDRTARLWSRNSGRLLAEPLNHESAVLSARTIEPEGETVSQGSTTRAANGRILTVSESNTVWLWSMPSIKQKYREIPLSRAPKVARFSPDGRKILVVADQKAEIFDWKSGERVMGPVLHADTYPIWDAVFAPDGQSFVTVSQYGDARLWNLVKGPGQFVRLQHENEVRHASFSPDGSRVITSSDDGTSRIWAAGSGNRLVTLKHGARVNFATFNHDGSRVATASWDGTARVWDAQTGEPRTPLLQHDDAVHWVGFSPDGSRLATASRDKTARLWDAKSGARLTDPLVHADELGERYSCAFSANGMRLVTAAGNSAQVWDVLTGRPVTIPVKHAGMIQSVRFNFDGTRFVTASSDGAVTQWNTESGQQVSETVRHPACVAYAEYSPGGTHLLTCATDQTARVWDVAVAPLPMPKSLPELAEAIAGQRINEHGVSEVVPVELLYQLKQKYKANEPSTFYDAWASSFLADK